MKPLLIAFACLLFIQPVFAQQKKEHITVDGIEREFVTYLPVAMNAGDKLPVIISLHGRLGTASGQMRFADFRPIADREKIIIVCPQGIDRSWNDGRDTPAHKKGINDVKFIDELISYIIKTYNADERRVYATGMSNGGFMTSRLACELSNRIAAIAVVAASMDKDMVSYKPIKAMPVMYIQGTDDPLVPFAGGEMKGSAKGMIYGHDDMLKEWARFDHCGERSSVTSLPVRVKDGTSVVREEYEGTDGLKVIGYTVAGGGHTWPGGTQYLPKVIIGRVSHNLDACEVIWDFFKNFKDELIVIK